MNDLQKTELELLKCFLDICERLELKYFLVCGSALGAVKYGGFIPWDDDLDVALPRPDYERLIERFPSLLPPYYFLQNYRSEPNFPQCFSKMRDSRTTYIEKTVSKIKMNHGVYIDIFPLDGYPADKSEQERLEVKKIYYKRLLSCNYTCERGIAGRVAVALFRLLGVHKRSAKIVKKYEDMISKYPVNKSEIICNHGNWQGKLEYAPRAQYGEGVMVEFEGLKVRVPEKYDEYLTQKYGDWRTELPEKEKKGHHYYESLDLERSYLEYLN